MTKEKNNKKKVLIACSIASLTILGSTLAYFTTTTNVANKFKTALYQNEIVENFVSPSNWTPGTITEKTIGVTNTGNVDMALRASYTESWTSANGQELSLTDTNSNRAAIINFGSDWSKDSDGYYYYGSKDNKTALSPNATSSSFINSVKFNENIESSLKETISDDGKTITYTSTGDGYDNATYKLTIKIDTVQYDQANNIWK